MSLAVSHLAARIFVQLCAPHILAIEISLTMIGTGAAAATADGGVGVVVEFIILNGLNLLNDAKDVLRNQ